MYDFNDVYHWKTLTMLAESAPKYLQILQFLESQKRIRCQVAKPSTFEHPIQS